MVVFACSGDTKKDQRQFNLIKLCQDGVFIKGNEEVRSRILFVGIDETVYPSLTSALKSDDICFSKINNFQHGFPKFVAQTDRDDLRDEINSLMIEQKEKISSMDEDCFHAK